MTGHEPFPRGLMAATALTVVLNLAACAPLTWTRAGATEQQIQQDGAECRITAYGNYPYREVIVEHDRGPTMTSDGNQMIRDADADFCMRARGYVLARKH